MQKKWVFLTAVAATVVVLDQWTKYAVLRDLTTAFDAAPGFGARLGIFASDAPAAPIEGAYHYQSKPPYTVLEQFLRFKYAENPGAAFGLLRGLSPGLRGPFFHLVTLGAVIFILRYYRKLSGTKQERWAVAGLPLVLGGAIGNGLCRLARGFVIDFIDAHWKDDPSLVWPSFNIADSAIVVGVGLLVIDSFVRKETKDAQESKDTKEKKDKKVTTPEPAK